MKINITIELEIGEYESEEMVENVLEIIDIIKDLKNDNNRD